jgi:hypothetical protein
MHPGLQSGSMRYLKSEKGALIQGTVLQRFLISSVFLLLMKEMVLRITLAEQLAAQKRLLKPTIAFFQN